MTRTQGWWVSFVVLFLILSFAVVALHYNQEAGESDWILTVLKGVVWVFLVVLAYVSLVLGAARIRESDVNHQEFWGLAEYGFGIVLAVFILGIILPSEVLHDVRSVIMPTGVSIQPPIEDLAIEVEERTLTWKLPSEGSNLWVIVNLYISEKGREEGDYPPLVSVSLSGNDEDYIIAEKIFPYVEQASVFYGRSTGPSGQMKVLVNPTSEPVVSADEATEGPVTPETPGMYSPPPVDEESETSSSDDDVEVEIEVEPETSSGDPFIELPDDVELEIEIESEEPIESTFEPTLGPTLFPPE